MKLYNCPDCQRDDSCDGCYRTKSFPSNTQTNSIDYMNTTFTNDPCAKCSNNPANGGSGFCNCILGLRNIVY